MLRRVLEDHESLGHVATDYGVFHEMVRPVILATAKEHDQQESQLYNPP